jgi:hypothetical protein
MSEPNLSQVGPDSAALFHPDPQAGHAITRWMADGRRGVPTEQNSAGCATSSPRPASI